MSIRRLIPDAAHDPRNARQSVRSAVGLVSLAVLLAGCAATASPAAPASSTLAEQAAALPAPELAAGVNVASAGAGAHAQTALATALLLEVKGRAPKTGYTREQFGPAWKDTDRNGCDQRNDVLRRDLAVVTFQTGTHECIVATGTLADPYSGRSIAFRRGQDTSSAVQIDHVVALSDAGQTGAQGWAAAKRVNLATDLRNLLAVDGPLNQQKSDGDAATWLPPNKAYRCAYVARQVGVKFTYGLWVTTAEQNAMVSILSGCPDQPLPAGVTPAPTPAPVAAPVPVAAAAPVAVAPVTAVPDHVEALDPAPAPVSAPAAVSYKNCAAVRAAGAAPIRFGQPGYARHLDADGDGVGCE